MWTTCYLLPSPQSITADQVTSVLRTLCARSTAGPDQVSPRLLHACAAELGDPLQHVFNLNLRLGKVPSLWKTSCIIPVPKKGHPTEVNDYRPVALTSHVMKTLEQLVLRLMRPQVQGSRNPLQFTYQAQDEADDAVLHLLHCALSYRDAGCSAVRVLFFDLSSTFNTIWPQLLQEKLTAMAGDPHLVTWITSYLTGRPQFV